MFKIAFTIISTAKNSERINDLLQTIAHVYNISTDEISAEPYLKFDNSYKTEFVIHSSIESFTEINFKAIELSQLLVSPWLLYFDNDTQCLELIFNKNTDSKHHKDIFETIFWAQIVVVKP